MSYYDYSKEDIDKIKEMFNFLDKNKKGTLSIEDIKLGIIGLGAELKEKEVIELKNKKDEFDLDDFIGLCQKKRINVNEIESKLLLAFSLLETDQKGYVPSSSLIALLKNDRVPEKDIEQLINEAKPDRENNINYRNFVKEILGAEDESNEGNKKNYNDNESDNYNNDNSNNKEEDNSY